MELNHAGIINKSEEDAAGFYRDFLGLELTRDFLLPQDLSEQLFSFKDDIKILVFERDGIKLEVFISADFRPATPDFIHTGFMVDDLPDLLERAGSSGVTVITGKTKDKTVHFLKDFSGNLVEVKQKPGT